jgi:hypothetical protein
MGLTDITLFATSPPSKDVAASDHRERVTEVARWRETAGFSGILTYAELQHTSVAFERALEGAGFLGGPAS